MLSDILFMISTVITMTIFCTEYFFLEALTVEFQAFGSFTITAKLFFSLTFHLIVLFIYGWQDAGIWSFTSLRKWWRGISDGILDREALIDSFFEWFAKGLRVDWVLCFEDLSISLWVLSWALVLDLWWYESLIRAGAVEHFSEIVIFDDAPFGFMFDGLYKGLIRDELNMIVLLNEEFLEQIGAIDGALFFNFGWLSDFG